MFNPEGLKDILFSCERQLLCGGHVCVILPQKDTPEEEGKPPQAGIFTGYVSKTIHKGFQEADQRNLLDPTDSTPRTALHSVIFYIPTQYCHGYLFGTILPSNRCCY